MCVDLCWLLLLWVVSSQLFHCFGLLGVSSLVIPDCRVDSQYPCLSPLTPLNNLPLIIKHLLVVLGFALSVPKQYSDSFAQPLVEESEPRVLLAGTAFFYPCKCFFFFLYCKADTPPFNNDSLQGYRVIMTRGEASLCKDNTINIIRP